MVLFNLKSKNIDLDTKYENITKGFKSYLALSLILLILCIIDGTFTVLKSKDKIKFLFEEGTFEHSKFGIFAISVLIFRAIFFLILTVWSFTLKKNMDRFPTSCKYE